jgi:hypothetical protein
VILPSFLECNKKKFKNYKNLNKRLLNDLTQIVLVPNQKQSLFIMIQTTRILVFSKIKIHILMFVVPPYNFII